MKEAELVACFNDIKIKEETRKRILNSVMYNDKTYCDMTVWMNRTMNKGNPMLFKTIAAMIALVIIAVPSVYLLGSYKTANDVNISMENKLVDILENADVSLTINEAEVTHVASHGIALMVDDCVTMKLDEIMDYYGINVNEEEFLPGFTLDSEDRSEEAYSIYQSESRGVYFDLNGFTFNSNISTGNVTIALSKINSVAGGIMLGDEDMDLQESKINGIPMTVISYTDDEGIMEYYTKFENRITSYNVCYTKLLRLAEENRPLQQTLITSLL